MLTGPAPAQGIAYDNCYLDHEPEFSIRAHSQRSAAELTIARRKRGRVV